MEQKLEELLTKLCRTRHKMEVKLSASIAKLKREVTSEDSTRSFTKADQVNLPVPEEGEWDAVLINVGVEEYIVLAQKGLDKMAPSDEAEKATLKKVSKHLDEGASALKMHQKHIKVANHSEYGWSMVRHYQSDPLTSDSEDKGSPTEPRRMPRKILSN